MDGYTYSVEIVGDRGANNRFGGLWPTDEKRITSPFGWRTHPKSGKRKFHNGIDIGTHHKIGVFVLAPVSGRVKWSESKAGGVQISVISGSREYIMCHLSKRLAPDGSYVRIGDLIALSGNTGGSTGPHLHFGIWDCSSGKREAIDPMSFWWLRINGFEGNPIEGADASMSARP